MLSDPSASGTIVRRWPVPAAPPVHLLAARCHRCPVTSAGSATIPWPSSLCRYVARRPAATTPRRCWHSLLQRRDPCSPATTRISHYPHPPPTRNRVRRGANGGRPPAFDAIGYKQRNTVERAFSKLRQHRAVATRYDKRDFVWRGTVHVASIRIRLVTHSMIYKTRPSGT